MTSTRVNVAPPPFTPSKIACGECRGTGYAEPAPTFTFGNDCPVCHGEGWLKIRQCARCNMSVPNDKGLIPCWHLDCPE